MFLSYCRSLLLACVLSHVYQKLICGFFPTASPQNLSSYLFLIEPLISLHHQHRCKGYCNIYVRAAVQNFMLQFQLISPIFPLRFTNFTFRLIHETHFPTAAFSSSLHFQRLLLLQTLVLPTDTLFYSVRKDEVIGHVARMKSMAYKVLAAQLEKDSLKDLSLDAVTY